MKDYLKMLAENFTSCLTIVDVKAKGRPCLFVNEKFTEETGYEAHEVIGKNLSILQGELSQKDTIEFMRSSFEQEMACVQDIINYKKDGTPFLNRLLMLPIKDKNPDSLLYVGFQNDVTLRKKNIYDNVLLQRVDNAEIRHMVNNPLTILLTSMVLLMQNSSTQKEIQREVKKLSHVFHRINDYALNIEKLSDFENFTP